MVQDNDRSAPGAAFREGAVEADGFRIRFMEAGEGAALVHLHGAGGLRLTPAHDLLRRQFRVIAVEMPGFGLSPENTRTRDMPELAATLGKAAGELGLATFALWGTSFGAKAALWLALQQQERVAALLLEAPAAIRPEGGSPPSGTPEEMARRLYAHPERLAPPPMPDPAVQDKQRRLVMRIFGPARDADLETRMSSLETPALVLFGTMDRLIPPEFGRLYKELMPNAHLVFVYDAGHAIAAERPQAFAEVAGDFLERREAFVVSRTATVIHP
ncbi:MAG TPA: alpha/beta hydrolase [Stellaceae bacterium]|nr:alpha/beta hydrolase [Stellaceae bacterium]